MTFQRVRSLADGCLSAWGITFPHPALSQSAGLHTGRGEEHVPLLDTLPTPLVCCRISCLEPPGQDLQPRRTRQSQDRPSVRPGPKPEESGSMHRQRGVKMEKTSRAGKGRVLRELQRSYWKLELVHHVASALHLLYFLARFSTPEPCAEF